MISPRPTIGKLMILVAIVGLSLGVKIWADANLGRSTQQIREIREATRDFWEARLGRTPDSPISPN